MRRRPQRILIEHGGGPGGRTLRAEIDPVDMPVAIASAISRLLDEIRPPGVADDAPGDTVYDVVLDYGDRLERLRYDQDELPVDVRSALDASLRPPEVGP